MRADRSTAPVSDARPPRWLVDEMLGRLARFLRILGYDTVYARGIPDEEIRQRALSEGRTLITRDGPLAARTSGAIVLVSTDLAGQLRELWAIRPELSRVPRFDRCTRCNGSLVPVEQAAARERGVPVHVLETAAPGTVYGCSDCGQMYWEGTHTAKIREFLRATAPSGGTG